MIYWMSVTAVFCLATIFHPNADNAYALKEDNPNAIASYKHQNMEVMKAPSIQMMKDCIMELDFSQAVVKPRDVNMREKYILMPMKIDFSKGKIESSAIGLRLSVRMPLRQYISTRLKETASFPKVAAWADYSIRNDGNVKLRVEGDDVPDEFGGTEDQGSFSLIVTLSYTDDTHAVANGVLRVEDDYLATIDQIKIKINKKNHILPKKIMREGKRRQKKEG